MKALLLHPEDSPRQGPWTREHWDLIVDLGRSSESNARAWTEELGCLVARLDSFRRDVEDPRLAGQILRYGRGRLLDREGIDWWELTSLLVHADLETLLSLKRLVKTLDGVTEIRASRSSWMTEALGLLAGKEVNPYSTGSWSRKVAHYAGMLRGFPPGQLAEIFFDKHDAAFRLRAKLHLKRQGATRPVVLLPSAYTNVSRMASTYARLVPEVDFLLVYTRRSGQQFVRPHNLSAASLSAYLTGQPAVEERREVHRKWIVLKKDLESIPELSMLCRMGLLGKIDLSLSDGLAVRDVWLEVFRREPIQAVLCGDDSNWYTRLPVAIARAKNVPTVDFHHGALDGRFLLKDLPSDWYLAKSEMEADYLSRVCGMERDRIVVGGPSDVVAAKPNGAAGNSIVFFSEPYETAGGRGEETYSELLPPLVALAASSGKRLVIKLHPFESASERTLLVRQVLPAAQREHVDVVSGPLTKQLLQQTWFGITVESTTVIECAMHGVPCFIAGWIGGSGYGYVQQYSAFGLGQLLSSAEQLLTIPSLLAERKVGVSSPGALWKAIDPDLLRRLLTGQYQRDPAGLAQVQPTQ